jgi:hypothetical protein
MQGNYSASYEAAEPDSHIVDLNTELVQCDELLSISLPKKARQCVGSNRLLMQLTSTLFLDLCSRGSVS